MVADQVISFDSGNLGGTALEMLVAANKRLAAKSLKQDRIKGAPHRCLRKRHCNNAFAP